ncbi:hypothetical protein MBRA1_002239 [Malassezia brasiliensis]|uniref:Guanine nucleotide-binding protein-like 3 N-terminal domain-containing protein n=1 Tax=Malassezia brasiliensis TaxID=1821822 RepID=A0AAF0DUA6_9BASI|nr:hypothetical protein MBRA1_002239 [Malassezia brasiliensis]
MVRVKKRASKRQTTKQREKVNRKVREHHRKQRREAKRNPNPQWRSRRRDDPGIPNSFPYKEELLNEIEQKRRVAEEQRMSLKQPTEAETSDASDDEEEHQPAPGYEEPLDLPHAPMLRTPLEDVLAQNNEVGVLVIALDARDPSAFRSAWLDAQLTKKSPEVVLALTKADLVPAEVLTAWVYALLDTKRAVFPVCVPPSTQAQGIEALAEYLSPKLKKKAAAVLGLENAGKTALATALQGVFQEKDGDELVYDTPAMIPKHASVPVPADSEDEEEEDEEEDEEEGEDAQTELARLEKQRHKLLWILARNRGNLQRFKDPLQLVSTLLSRVAHPEDLMLIYGTPAFGSFVPAPASLDEDAPADEALLEQELLAQDKAHADTEQFLIGVARSVGRLKRKGVPDTIGAARRILRDWSHAGLAYYAKPPVTRKAVQTTGTKADQTRWDKAQAQVDHIAAAVLPRKLWREQWEKRELRLTVLPQGPLADEPLVFAPVPDEDEDEDEDENVPVYGDDEEDEEEDEEVEEEEEEEEDEEEDEEEEEIPPPQPSRKRRAPAAAPSNKRHAAPAPKAVKADKGATKRKPAPGEAYDLNAYF